MTTPVAPSDPTDDFYGPFWPSNALRLRALDDVELLHAMAMHGESQHLGAGARSYHLWLDALPPQRARAHVAYLIHRLLSFGGPLAVLVELGWRAGSFQFGGPVADACVVMWAATPLNTLQTTWRIIRNVVDDKLIDAAATLKETDDGRAAVDAVLRACEAEMKAALPALRMIDLRLDGVASTQVDAWNGFVAQHKVLCASQLRDGTDLQVVLRMQAMVGFLLGDDRRAKMASAMKPRLVSLAPRPLVELTNLLGLLYARLIPTDTAELVRAASAARMLQNEGLASFIDEIIAHLESKASPQRLQARADELAAWDRAPVDAAAAAWLRVHADDVVPPPLVL